MAGRRVTKKSKHEFATLLREWRANMRFTQREAADHLGLPLRSLQNWEIARSSPRGYGRTALELVFKNGR